MKLKIGQFVRTKDGIIDKVIIDYNGHCANPNCECKHISCAKNYYDEDKIKKASYNIIDLIKEGDYIDGQKVYYSEEFNALYVQGFNVDGDFYMIFITKKSFINNIETIVTKEQFEQMSYKIKESR